MWRHRASPRALPLLRLLLRRSSTRRNPFPTPQVPLPSLPQVLVRTPPLPCHGWVPPCSPRPHSLPQPRFFSADSTATAARMGGDREESDGSSGSESEENAVIQAAEGAISLHEGGSDVPDPTPSSEFEWGEPGDGTTAAAAASDEVSGVNAEEFDKVLFVLHSDELEGSLSSSLDQLDLVPTEEFLLALLQDSVLPAANLVEFFDWTLKRPEFVMTSSVLELFVEKACGSADLSSGEAFVVWDLIKGIRVTGKDLLNARVLNHMICAFSRLGKGKFVVEVFNAFEDMGCEPDGDTYYLTIHALGKRSWADTAWAVCERMLSSRNFPESDKVGKIIKFFCKGGKARDARSVYLAAEGSDKSPPSIYLDVLVDHLSRKDDSLHMAVDLLEKYSGDSLKHANKPYISVISGLCRIKDTAKAKELLDRMIHNGPPPEKAVFNYIITALSKSGEVEGARGLLASMRSRGLKPDIRAYNVIMGALCRGGLIDEAHELFSEAKKVHKKLGRVSYHILSRGYCRIDDFENAIKCMTMMKQEGLQPNLDEYRKMVQSLCLKALDWRAAEKLLEEMKDAGLRLDGQTRGLIEAVKELEEEEMQSAGLVA